MTRNSVNVYDSLTGMQYPRHRIYAVAYEPAWQGIRLASKFRTNDEIATSCATLAAYIQEAQTPADKQYRVYRAWNLMNAIPIGLYSTKTGIAKIPRDRETLIVSYRTVLHDLIRVVGLPTEWDWHWSRLGLMNILKADPEFIPHMIKMLVYKRATRLSAKPELHHFLDMAKEVLDGQD